MKKYLLFAVLLGAIAFTGVSFLANAEPETGKVEAVIDTSMAAKTEAVSPEVDAFMAEINDCEAGVKAGSNGREMDVETYQNTLISCMNAKGYSAEDVKGRYLDHQTMEEVPQDTDEEGMMQE